MRRSHWDEKPDRRAAWFSTTHWSLVLAAGDSRNDHSQEALEVLCDRYWYPLYAYVRRRGFDPEGAKDLTQGFFAQFLEKGYLGRADRDRGRFRSFLLASLKHYLADQRDREQAQKRGGHARILSIDLEKAEEKYQLRSSEGETPEQVFDRQWALAQLNRAFEQLRADMGEKGDTRRFEILKGFLAGEENRGSYGAAAAKLELSEGTLRVAVHRMRRRFGEILRREIADTVEEEGKIEEEIRYLFASLS